MDEHFEAAGAKPSLDAMRQHIERLTAQHDIVWTRCKRACDAWALRERDGARDEIYTPPITGEITYATALHEIGHIRGRYQGSANKMTRELWAWNWARRNAIVWTPRMERDTGQALQQARRVQEALVWMSRQRRARSLRDKLTQP